jgi:hypothetical protein
LSEGIKLYLAKNARTEGLANEVQGLVEELAPDVP